MQPKGRYNCSPDDIDLDLVFFSAFEDLLLRTTGTEESNGIRKLYEPSPVLTLYVGRVDLDGNSTSTTPYKYTGRQKQAFEFGYAQSLLLTAKAPHHAGAAMYMRSTTGCESNDFQ